MNFINKNLFASFKLSSKQRGFNFGEVPVVMAVISMVVITIPAALENISTTTSNSKNHETAHLLQSASYAAGMDKGTPLPGQKFVDYITPYLSGVQITTKPMTEVSEACQKQFADGMSVNATVLTTSNGGQITVAEDALQTSSSAKLCLDTPKSPVLGSPTPAAVVVFNRSSGLGPMIPLTVAGNPITEDTVAGTTTTPTAATSTITVAQPSNTFLNNEEEASLSTTTQSAFTTTISLSSDATSVSTAAPAQLQEENTATLGTLAANTIEGAASFLLNLGQDLIDVDTSSSASNMTTTPTVTPLHTVTPDPTNTTIGGTDGPEIDPVAPTTPVTPTPCPTCPTGDPTTPDPVNPIDGGTDGSIITIPGGNQIVGGIDGPTIPGNQIVDGPAVPNPSGWLAMLLTMMPGMMLPTVNTMLLDSPTYGTASNVSVHIVNPDLNIDRVETANSGFWAEVYPSTTTFTFTRGTESHSYTTFYDGSTFTNNIPSAIMFLPEGPITIPMGTMMTFPYDIPQQSVTGTINHINPRTGMQEMANDVTVVMSNPRIPNITMNGISGSFYATVIEGTTTLTISSPGFGTETRNVVIDSNGAIITPLGDITLQPTSPEYHDVTLTILEEVPATRPGEPVTTRPAGSGVTVSVNGAMTAGSSSLTYTGQPLTFTAYPDTSISIISNQAGYIMEYVEGSALLDAGSMTVVLHVDPTMRTMTTGPVTVDGFVVPFPELIANTTFNGVSLSQVMAQLDAEHAARADADNTDPMMARMMPNIQYSSVNFNDSVQAASAFTNLWRELGSGMNGPLLYRGVDGRLYNVNVMPIDPLKISLIGEHAKLNSDDHFVFAVQGFNGKSWIKTAGGLNQTEAWLMVDRERNYLFKKSALDGNDVFGDHNKKFRTGFEDLAQTFKTEIKRDAAGKRYIPLRHLNSFESSWIWLTRFFGANTELNPSYDLKLVTRDHKTLQASALLKKVYVDYKDVEEVDEHNMNWIRQRSVVEYRDGRTAQSADQWVQTLFVLKPVTQ